MKKDKYLKKDLKDNIFPDINNESFEISIDSEENKDEKEDCSNKKKKMKKGNKEMKKLLI